MPQISPMSWVFVPFLFFTVSFFFLFSLWWCFKSPFSFSESSRSVEVSSSTMVWIW